MINFKSALFYIFQLSYQKAYTMGSHEIDFVDGIVLVTGTKIKSFPD